MSLISKLRSKGKKKVRETTSNIPEIGEMIKNGLEDIYEESEATNIKSKSENKYDLSKNSEYMNYSQKSSLAISLYLTN